MSAVFAHAATAPRPGDGLGEANEPLLVRALRGEPVERVPVWFMRQAGRCLPEYRAVRERASLLEICRDPHLAAEVTAQPVRRLGVDAAIIFSDITLPLAAAGVELEIVPGVGPVIAKPIRSEADLSGLRPFEPAEDAPFLAESIRLAASELSVPVIGFAGGPFTLASYLVEGGPSKTHALTRSLMYTEQALWERLLAHLADVAIAALRCQVAAGAQAVQVFESWAGALDPDSYARFVLPAARRIFEGLADLGVPRIHFGVGTGELLELMAAAGADAMGVDWHVPLDRARARLGREVALQGNLDPAACLAPWQQLRPRVDAVLDRGAGGGHVFNLGHGVLPETSPDALRRIVEHVHERGVQPPERHGAELAGTRGAAGPRGAASPRGAAGSRESIRPRACTPVGVLVMAYGTPASLAEVEAYYTHIRRGRAPEPAQLQELVGRYEAIGGSSPLLEICNRQASGLGELLNAERDGRFHVQLGMKHAPPFIEEGVERLLDAGCRRAVGLVLAPHRSRLSVDEYIARASDAADGRLELAFIEQWHLLPSYIDLLVRGVQEAMAGFPPALRDGLEVVFTAHSLPQRILEWDDPYPGQLQATAEAVAQRAGLERFSIAWQSAGRTAEPWLGPDVLEVTRSVAESGARGMIVCPAGFTSDHLEVLYDLDIECRQLAESLGLWWRRTESLNAHPALLGGLADLVRQAASRPSADQQDARQAPSTRPDSGGQPARGGTGFRQATA